MRNDIRSPRPPSEAHALLWEVWLPRPAHPSYLLGTIHLDCDPPWMKSVRRLLRPKHWLATEVDFTRPRAPHVWAGPGCRSMLGLRWGRVALASTRVGLWPAPLANLPPIAAWCAIAGAASSDEFGRTVDARLVRDALTYRLAVHGLETAEETFASLGELALDVQVDVLVRSAGNLCQTTRREIDEALEQIRCRYIMGYPPSFAPEPKGWQWPPELLEVLLHARNERMTRRFVELASRAPGMAAVGAAHLYGASGMVARLRAEGFEVRGVAVLTDSDTYS